MANTGYVYQQVHTVSIPRDGLVKIATSNILSIDDYKVLIMLLTQLDGYARKYESYEGKRNVDPDNYRIIDVEKIAETLDMKKKDVKKSIKRIYDLYLIEKGENATVRKGYRFTF